MCVQAGSRADEQSGGGEAEREKKWEEGAPSGRCRLGESRERRVR